MSDTPEQDLPAAGKAERHEFSSFVTGAEDDDRSPEERARTDAMVRDLLRRTSPGNEPGPAASFIDLLSEMNGESVEAIAASMEIRPDFLIDVSEHGGGFPLAVRVEMVRRARLTRAVDEREARQTFTVARMRRRRVAARDGIIEPTDPTYTEVVSRSSLSTAQKRLWLDLA